MQDTCAGTPPTTAEHSKEESLALKEEGTKAYKNHDWVEAERLYKEAYARDPENLLLLNNIGAVYLECGRYEDCIKVTEEALAKRYEVKADYAVVAKLYKRRGACFLKMDRYDEAIDAYKKSLVEINDRETRELLKNAESQKEKYLLLKELDPEAADVLRSEGNEFFKAKNAVEAKGKYDLALKKNPYDARIYSNRAACYIQLLEYPSALIDCEKALKLVEHSQQANPDEEVTDVEEKLKRAKVDDSVVVRIYCRQGMCHLKLKDFNKAQKSYEHALTIDPQNAEARRGLNEVMFTTYQTANSKEIDAEQQARAMADPEIQQILGDPQMHLILQNLQSDPSRLREAIKDPKVALAIQKLMTAGILRTA